MSDYGARLEVERIIAQRDKAWAERDEARAENARLRALVEAAEALALYAEHSRLCPSTKQYPGGACPCGFQSARDAHRRARAALAREDDHG